MKNITDATGNVILSYFKKQHTFDIVEREDGYINVDDAEKMYFSEYIDWRNHEKEAISYAHGRCLDIGCGAGRVLLYLQSKGLFCLGIDSSPLAIKVCKMRGVKHSKVMDLTDISKFKEDSFDSIILFGNNFGLLANKLKAKRLLKNMYKITSKNAVIIAEDRDPYITTNPTHFKYHSYNIKRGRMPGQLKIRVRFMQYKTPWYDYLYLSKSEMKSLINGTGWKITKFINEKNFKSNGEYIAILRKAI